jgi:hypothetical protein
MGDQCVEAAAEGERRGDDQHGEGGAEQRRTHRDRSATTAVLKGEADSDGC